MYFPEKADPTPVEKRSDDRFAVQSRVTVTPLNEPSRKMDALLADVSATGFRLILPEALASGTRVVVELESHIALAEVRYLYPRGDKFATGAMKLASVLRLELPDDATWEQKVRKLLKESSVG